MNKFKKLLGATLISVIALSIGTAMPASANSSFGDAVSVKIHPSNKGWCASFDDVPVAPADGQPRSWDVALTYCQPFIWAAGAHQVDVLTPGATYTQAYWDWPEQPEIYSYVGKTLKSGRATLNYDRIGSGESFHPLSTEITMASDSFVLHQLVQGLKQLGYTKVNSISHSYGTGIALAEAAAHADVSKVVVSGYLHRPSNPAVTAGNYQANLDPKFLTSGIDDGYLTSRPGVRGTSFHSPTTDPNVVQYDEDHKDLVSRTGLLNFLGQRGVAAADNISNDIYVPVLVINGQQDAIFCYNPSAFNCADVAAVNANEAPYYASASKFKVVTVPEAGHDLTLHKSAKESYKVINQWLSN